MDMNMTPLGYTYGQGQSVVKFMMTLTTLLIYQHFEVLAESLTDALTGAVTVLTNALSQIKTIVLSVNRILLFNLSEVLLGGQSNYG